MANWSDVLKLLPRLALQMLPGVMMGGPASGRFSKALQAGANKKLKGAAFTYPGLTSNFTYPIVYVGNSPTWVNNATLNRNIAPEALRSQTLEEHNAALMQGGEAAEKALQSWWPGENNSPRVNPTPGSSAVSGVRILPNNKIQVQFRGGGKWYTYRGGKNPYEASMAAAELLQAPSIGRMMNRNGKYAHTSPTDKDGHIDSNVGAWGRRHYDPNW